MVLKKKDSYDRIPYQLYLGAGIVGIFVAIILLVVAVVGKRGNYLTQEEYESKAKDYLKAQYALTDAWIIKTYGLTVDPMDIYSDIYGYESEIVCSQGSFYIEYSFKDGKFKDNFAGDYFEKEIIESLKDIPTFEYSSMSVSSSRTAENCILGKSAKQMTDMVDTSVYLMTVITDENPDVTPYYDFVMAVRDSYPNMTVTYTFTKDGSNKMLSFSPDEKENKVVHDLQTELAKF